MKVKEYIARIIANGNSRDMEELSDMLDKAIYKVKDCDQEWYNEKCMKLYTMAYGKVLTDDMKKKWVQELKPISKWSYEEIENVVRKYNINIPVSSAYIIMNMLYSDLKNVLGNGENEESLQKYIETMQYWYYDEDAKNSEENKLFEYYFNIVK
nr:MAG TPA: hypothetical protein [Caudoviricetes sp.]